jgi:hypothetical protein
VGVLEYHASGYAGTDGWRSVWTCLDAPTRGLYLHIRSI